jgi:hypothetical protein
MSFCSSPKPSQVISIVGRQSSSGPRPRRSAPAFRRRGLPSFDSACGFGGISSRLRSVRSNRSSSVSLEVSAVPVKRVTLASYTILREFPEHLQGLGLIAAEWAGLENRMATTFGAILDNPDAGEATLLSLGSFTAKADVIKRCVPNGTAKDALLAALTKARKCGEKRNDLLHNLWVLQTGELQQPWQWLRKPAAAKPFETLHRTAKELEDHATKIALATEGLKAATDQLLNERRAARAPSGGTPP